MPMTSPVRAWGSRWLRGAVLVAAGLLLGHFVVPWLLPRDFHGLRVHPNPDGCTVEFSTERYYLWHQNPGMGDLSGKLQCNQSMVLLPNFVVACVCKQPGR